MAVVETSQRKDGGRVTEVAAELGTAKSTAYPLLSTLLDLGYLRGLPRFTESTITDEE